MIKTRDLVKFTEDFVAKVFCHTELDKEYIQEITKRLRERDELIKGIKDLIARMGEDTRTMSNGVDK